MQATVLSYFRLGQWLKTNNCPDVLPFYPVIISTTTEIPAAFALNVPMSNLYGSEPSSTEFVQIVVSQSIPTDDECKQFIDTGVPFVMIVTANSAHDQRIVVAPPSDLPMYKTELNMEDSGVFEKEEGEEKLNEIAGNIQVPRVKKNLDGRDMGVVNETILGSICDLLIERHALLQEWVKLSDKHGSRGTEFLRECDNIFINIAMNLANGDVIAPTRAWLTKLKHVLKSLESVSERFLRMQQVVPTPPSTAQIQSKRYRPVKQLDVAAPGLAADTSVVETQPDGQPAPNAVSGQKLSESEMDERLARMNDPLTRFILLSLGWSASAPHRGYRSLPTISSVYSSEERINAYLTSVHTFVLMALRELETNLAIFMLNRFGKAFKLGMVLPNPDSILFAACAKLTGNLMRKNMLYSVTRNGFTAHARLEYQKEINESLVYLHNLIPNTTDLVIYWDRG